MKNKYLLFALAPIIILFELVGLSYVTELAREPSDVAVFMAVCLLCLLLIGNYFLLKFLISKFKPNKK